MSECGCAEASKKTFQTVVDGIAFGRTSVLRDDTEIGRNEKKWVFLIRCGQCGTVWAEACWTSGHMDIYYIFSVPQGEDPLEWLLERAEPLKWDERGPTRL